MAYRGWGLAAVACASLSPAMALADPQALSPNVPVEIEDALVVKRGVFQLQLDQRFTRDHTTSMGGDTLTAEPVFKLGAAKGLQLDFSPAYNYGSASGTDNGLASVDALYQINPNSTYVPAFAVHGYVQTGYGHDAPSTQYTVRAIATKYLGGDKAPRLHLNLTWVHITRPGEGDRDDTYSVGVGYSQLVRKDTAVVVDFVHGQKSAFHQDQDLIDIGLIHQFNDQWSVAFGAGGGVGEQAPEKRVFVALQRSFTLFGGGGGQGADR